MEQAMNDVQLQLASEGISKRPRVPPGHPDTDENLTVFEREHIRRTASVQKLSMQLGHPPIGDEQHKNLTQLA